MVKGVQAMSFINMLVSAAELVLGKHEINRIAINRLVKAGPSRPHAWSTIHDDYISWDGLTDRSYFARLLPPTRIPENVALGTRHPPIEDLIPLFLAPRDQQRPCRKSTCLFPAFAQYLTDGFLRTRMFNDPPGAHTRPGVEDRRRTTSNHEIDLSALYGRTVEQTAVLRSGIGGRLKSQTIGGEEFPPFLYGDDQLPKSEFCDAGGILVLDEPLGVDSSKPGLPTLFAVGGDRVNASVQVAAINTLFLREHNRLAALLAADHPGWDDERLFQIARNINIVQFITIVVEEYINHISSAPFRFIADPSVAWDEGWNRANWMTIEFTLLYRWHSLVPERLVWNGNPVESPAFLLDNTLLCEGGLAHALAELSANPAARMGLGNFAWFFDKAEAKGIAQGRYNDLASYNAYREVMGLSRKQDFADLVGASDDPGEQVRNDALAAELERLYGEIDNLEFYVGLFAEHHADNCPTPELLLAMVAMDAFSQALPNPLLSRRIWEDENNLRRTFADAGVASIKSTHSLRDILVRNGGARLGDRFIGMTRPDWTEN
jgi:prostaglandin-endoperoxide synthase 2